MFSICASGKYFISTTNYKNISKAQNADVESLFE